MNLSVIVQPQNDVRKTLLQRHLTVLTSF